MKCIFTNVQVGQGTEFYWPPNCYSNLSQMINNPIEYPYNKFIIESYIDNGSDAEKLYVANSYYRKKKIKIFFSEYAVKYCLGKEVDIPNSGIDFGEYLPIAGSEIIGTDNKGRVFPAVFFLSEEKHEDDYIYVECKLKKIPDNVVLDVMPPYKWKLIEDSDEFMTEYEKLYRDTIIHKKLVTESCEKLAGYLEEQKIFNHAKALRERAFVHDNSKIMEENEEFKALSKIVSTEYNIGKLPKFKEEAIKLHWKNNCHHPEHYESPLDMSKLDIMEMCCDWHARSIQFGTNLMEYVYNQQENRFHFPDLMFCEIQQYLKMLIIRK